MASVRRRKKKTESPEVQALLDDKLKDHLAKATKSEAAKLHDAGILDSSQFYEEYDKLVTTPVGDKLIMTLPKKDEHGVPRSAIASPNYPNYPLTAAPIHNHTISASSSSGPWLSAGNQTWG